MKRWIKGVLLTGAVCCAAGVGIAAAGIAAGGAAYVSEADLNTLRGDARTDDAEHTAVLEKSKIESFQSIDASLDTLDLDIRPSGDESCYIAWQADTENGYAPVFETVTDGTLLLLENEARNDGIHIDIGFFSEIFRNGVQKDESAKNCVTLYVPDNTLTELKLQSDTGDIRLSQINVPRGEIRMDTGDLSLSECTMTNIEVWTETGDVNSSQGTLDTCVLETDYGEVSLDCVQFLGTVVIESDTGGISVTDTKEKLCALSFSIETETGNLSIPDAFSGGIAESGKDHSVSYQQDGAAGGAALEIKTDCGDISIRTK